MSFFICMRRKYVLSDNILSHKEIILTKTIVFDISCSCKDFTIPGGDAMATRNRASLQAGLLVKKALNSGMSLADITEKTGVGGSTLQRWKTTGMGEVALVRKLERLVGSVEITADELSTILAEEYSKSGTRRAFAVYNTDLYRVVGPLLDSDGYLEAVRERLRQRGFELLQTRKGGRLVHHVISFIGINKFTSENMRDFKDRWREADDETLSPDVE
jgi:hypothetical protein